MRRQYPSFVAMRPKGSTDQSFYFDHVILPLYLNVQQETIQDQDRCKIKGPLCIKTNTGPGQLSSNKEHLTKQEVWLEKGVHNFLGLPNGTESSQEMNQWFTEFKSATDASTICIAAMKMAKRFEGREKMRLWLAQEATKKEGVQEGSITETNDGDPSHIANLEEFLAKEDQGEEGFIDKGEEGVADVGEEGMGNEDDTQANFSFEVKGSVCDVKIDNCYLSAIVNRFPGDPIKLHPFDNIFQCKNIWKWWCEVGFIPMNRNILYKDKARQELVGEKAAVCNQGENLILLCSIIYISFNCSTYFVVVFIILKGTKLNY